MLVQTQQSTGDASPDDGMSVTRRTVRGARLALTGWGTSQGLLFLAYLVLARLITPRGFGNYAAASLTLGVGGLFAEGGMMSALITRKTRIDEAASTAFFSLLVSGTLLMCVALLASPLFGLFFRSSQVEAMTAVLSAGLLIQSLTIVPDALLQRRMSFARRVAIDPLGAVAFGAVAIPLSLNGFGAWSLVAATYASLTLKLISSWAFVRDRPRLRLASIAMWRELASYARPVLGSEALRRVAGQLDVIVLGRFAGGASLGQYRNGLRLAQQPTIAFIDVGSWVLLPTLVRIGHHTGRFASGARRIYSLLAAIVLPLGLAALPMGVPVAVLLLGPRWRPAGHAIAGLCGLLIGAAIVSVSSEVLKASMRPRDLVRIHTLSLSATSLLVCGLAIPFGLLGAAIAVSVSQCLTGMYAFHLVKPHVDLRWRDLGAAFKWPALASGLMLLAMFSFAETVHPLRYDEVHALALTVAEALLGGIVYCGGLMAVDRRRRDGVLRLLHEARERRRSRPAESGIVTAMTSGSYGSVRTRLGDLFGGRETRLSTRAGPQAVAQLPLVGPDSLKWLAVLAGCAAVGLLAGINPVYGIGASLGVAFMAVSFANVTVGLAIFTCLSFLEALNNGATAGSTSLLKVAGLVLFASWYVATQTRTEPGTHAKRLSSGQMVSLIALLAWSALSVAWAQSSGTAAGATGRYLLNILLFPIVLGAVRRRDHLIWVLGAFVLGAVLSTLYGFAHPVAAGGGDYGRLTGGLGDSNEQAAVLVAAIPIAIGLAAVMRHQPLKRTLAIAAALICLAGVVNTLSRGGLVALGVVMVAAVFVSGRWRRWAVALLLATTIGVAGYFVAIAPSTARDRVTKSDTSGRADIWTVGWRMFQAHPLTGVGSANFQTVSADYVQQPGDIQWADFIVDQPHVAHNIYLQFLADLGIPGLLAFLAVVIASLAAMIRAATLAQRTGQRDLEVIARSLVLSLIAFMAADFFLSGEFSKQLWLILALGPAVLAVTREQPIER